MKVSIIIPVFNEEMTVGKLLDKVFSSPVTNREIIIVNDGSTDDTLSVIRKSKKSHPTENIKIINLNKNYGKGFAVRVGLRFIEGDIIIIQDADLELDPLDYEELVKPIIKGIADVVYGNRFQRRLQDMRYLSFVGNFIVTTFTNFLYKANLSDEATGYKVFKKDVIKNITLECKGFEFCAEITAKILNKGYSIVEVPITFHPRSYSEGKKVGWWDGIVALWTLFKFRFF
jgi:dolichol-phosphate mannosyltransferase